MMTDEIVKPPRAAWFVPALCCGISLSLCAAGGALFAGSLLLALIGTSDALPAAGLLAAAVLGAAGGISLLWSIGRMGKSRWR